VTAQRILLVLLTLPLGIALAGCDLISGLPSQANPTCSWTSEPPKDEDAVCRTVFRTLQALTRAEEHGDDATIRRLVPAATVASRIIAFGSQNRRDGLKFLYSSPSLTLGASVNHTLGVVLHVVGESRAGKFSDPESVFVRLRGGTAYVVADQPEQEW
jgi:hypothetical protein